MKNKNHEILRSLIRELLLIEKKRSGAPIAGSYPEDRYMPATKQNLMLDRPTSHGGWPEGEYDPPINKKIYDYLKSLGLVQ